jgi:hypothetical protein
MSADERGGAGAAATLLCASGELRNTMTMVDDLENAVGLAIALAGGAGPDQMLELQKLDHISQKILGVADFLEALGEGLPGDWRVDAHKASRRVLLAELGRRLGSPESVEAPPPTPVSAECEMF